MHRWQPMLLAVEGGGLFFSSDSGYIKGLSSSSWVRSMRMNPTWEYPCGISIILDLEHWSDLQLASIKNWISRRCASFSCFGRVSAGLDTASPLKVGPAQQQETFPDPLDLDTGNDHAIDVEDDHIVRKVTLKSSLKKPTKHNPVPVEHKSCDGFNGSEEHDDTRRRIQWTDVCGNELVEIWEFEPRYWNFIFQLILQGLHLFYYLNF